VGIGESPSISAVNRIVNVLLCLIVCCASQATVIMVPSECLTIQAAIDDANDGDTVIVAPGTYAGEGNRDIDFKGKAIILKSEVGPESCIIQCGGRYPSYGPPQKIDPEYHRGFSFHSHEDANSVVEGLTVTQGYMGPHDGGAIYCMESSPTIRDCIIIGNAARDGGGIAAYQSDVRVENCIIMGNVASWTGYDRGGGMSLHRENARVLNCLVVGNIATHQGGGIYCRGSHQFVNCTVTGNRIGKEGLGGGISCGPDGDDISHLYNSIVWRNTAGLLGNDIALPDVGILWPMELQVGYSLIGDDPNDLYDPHERAHGHWTTGDPHFVDPGHWDPNGTPDKLSDDFWVDGDYHLKSQAGRWDSVSKTWVQDQVTSPCIDAGDPLSPVGPEPFPNGGRINMGAYGGTAEASKSYFGKPVCETIIAGDINGDCRVDLKDVAILAGHWLEDQMP